MLEPLGHETNHSPPVATPLGEMAQEPWADACAADPSVRGRLVVHGGDLPRPHRELDEHRSAVADLRVRRDVDSLPHAVLLRELELVELCGMPEVLYTGKLHCIGSDKGGSPRVGILGDVAAVPIAGWKWRKELAKQHGLECAVILASAKRAWRRRCVLDVLPVDEEAIVAVVSVVAVDETCEKAVVGVFFVQLS